MSNRMDMTSLFDYLSNFNKNEPIYLVKVKNELITLFNKELSISFLEKYFNDNGYTNIQLKEKRKDRSLHNGIDEAITEKPEIKNEDNEDDNDDFDPNVFIRKNKERILQTAVEASNYKENTWIIEKYRKERNLEVLNELLLINRGLVESIANRYMKRTRNKLDYEDLVNEGFLGLMKSIEKFDPSLGYQFSTYATWWIRQSITRAIIDKGYTVRIPVHMYESINKVLKYERESIRSFNEINIKWVTEQLNITEERYCELIKIDYMFLHLASLDIIVSEEENDTTLLDFLEYDPLMGLGSESELFKNPEILVIKNELKPLLEECMENLTEREREVLKHRSGWYDNIPKTLEQIGEIYNVTRERIRQIESKAIMKLRHHVRKKKIDFEYISYT